MKRIAALCLVALMLCACQRLPLPGAPTGRSTTPVPYVDPNVAHASESTQAAATATPIPAPSPDVKEKAMLKDIMLLIERSTEQQGQEQNYKNLKKDQYLIPETVTEAEIKFAGKPQVFKGDYTGRYTPGKKYQYFEEADMGGKRYYTVKDNFGVWISFQYIVPIGAGAGITSPNS